MCGIVGAVASSAVDPLLVERMRDRLSHRGPDAAGLWSTADRRVCLGHRRLTIVDPSPEANQPVLSADGRYSLTLNGEIYNFRALREELAAGGVALRTRSDTEVLLESYRRWGAGCLERLSGMFAFGIWDADRNRLFCARDRAGEKPFHYAVTKDAFVFASELKALLLWPGFRRELDYTALADYLAFGFVPDPKSIWEGASKLPPGHSLTVELGESGPRVGEPVQWWDFTFDPDQSVDDWDGAIRDALRDAAGEMSFADVPVGTFLSGGVDSSSVTAALRQVGSEVRTFTIGFDEDGFDERPFAREVAALYGTAHTERTVVPGDVGALFRDTILWHYDEPFNDYSYLPTYALCREARRSITVALSGDGGDEVFAGYPKYRRIARRHGIERALTRPVTQLVATGAHAVRPWRDAVAPYRQGADEMLLSMLVDSNGLATLRSAARGELARTLEHYDPMDVVGPHLAKAPPAEVGLVNAMRYLDFKLTLAGDMLVKVDRASMAVALEVRPVYLNRRVLELAGRIPPARLADGRDAKKALRSALRSWLPSSILNRPKAGFAMPLGHWLQRDQTLVPAGNGQLGELLDPSYTRGTAEAHLSGKLSETSRLHSMLFLEHWLEKWQ